MMLEGYWRALWPLIVIAFAPEVLAALGVAVILAGLVWWGVRRKRGWMRWKR